MNNLLKIGISENLIDRMIDFNGAVKVTKLDKKAANAFKIIATLKEIHITPSILESLLIYTIDLFFLDFDVFTSKIKENDILELSETINNDFESVNDIFLSE